MRTSFTTQEDINLMVLIINILEALLLPVIFMLVWNLVITKVCGFEQITYLQSFFIGVAIRAINGSFRVRSN